MAQALHRVNKLSPGLQCLGLCGGRGRVGPLRGGEAVLSGLRCRQVGGHHVQKKCGLAGQRPCTPSSSSHQFTEVSPSADLRSGQSEFKGLKAVAGLRGWYFPSPAGVQD